jgi:hypothetical protein
MKDFNGAETQADYYEIEKRGKLTAVFGAGKLELTI